ncbi:MFS transporter [Paenibacillus tyrfis]|uniref:staphylopine family metallophore export MFS transporter CntE n=1 Tax=Paenibacillus tyrfis TaxID=1501230 RepID=UPI00248F9EAA|nr:MFS transporter [Paenibacillus tyrfis]GLI08216.1 MFS transporter [Paenibacillus tyrfis]
MRAPRPLSIGFIRIYVLACLFFTANAILTVILPLKSEMEGIGKAEIGVMMGAYMLFCLFLRPWAGQTVARFGALPTMRILLIVHACGLVMFTFFGVASYLPLRALQGAVTAFFSMAMQMGIVDALSDRDRAQGVSLYALSTMLPQLFGPIMALYLWEHDQMPIIGITLVALGLLTWLCGLSAPLPSTSTKGATLTITDMMKSVSQLWSNRILFVCSAVMLTASITYGAIMTFLPLYMQSIEKGDAGLYLMLQAAVVVFCRFALRKKIPSDGRWHTGLIAVLLLSAAAGSLLLGILQTAGPLFYLSAICNGAAIALIYPTLMTYLSFVLSANSRHVLLGLFISSYDLGFSLGGLMMGPLAERFSYSQMYTCCAWLSIAALIIVIGNKNKMSDRSNSTFFKSGMS